MNDREDRLAVSYNTFFAVLGVPPPSEKRAEFAFAITPRGRMSDAKLTLQLVLHPGETLETDGGRSVRLDETPQELEVSGWIRHHGWTLKLSAPARLTWPVLPYNPYRNAPETGIEHAVGALTTDLRAETPLVTFSIEE
jgi:hypothetical protein